MHGGAVPTRFGFAVRLEDQVAVLKRKLEESEKQLDSHTEARAREVERERQKIAKLNKQLESSLAEAEARLSAGEREWDGTKRELSELKEVRRGRTHSSLPPTYQSRT